MLSRVLRTGSNNTLSLLVWSLDAGGAAAQVKLMTDGAFSSSNTFSDWTEAPDYQQQVGERPTANVHGPM